MIGITIREHKQHPDYVRVEVWRDDGEVTVLENCAVKKCKLREFADSRNPAEIWHDGERVELCVTPGCWELVRKSDPCPLCEGCLAEYQQEEADYRRETALRAYAGVIG